VLKKFYRLKRKEDGQAVVEFALVLPILLLVVLGIMEFGWLFYGNIVITSAAREGARTAVVGGTQTQIETAVKNHTDNAGINNVTVQKAVDGDEVSIDVEGDLKPIVGLFLEDPVNVAAEATMRKE